MQNAYMYDATLLSFSGGVVTKNSDNSYSYVIENENGNGMKSIAIKVANVDDLSAYEGKSCPVQGVLDVAATYPETALTLVLRTESDFLESNVEFETLADMIAAGEPAGTSVTYALKNPVLVTYKFAKGGGDNAVATYFFMVQDNTAGIVVSLGTTGMANIKEGDYICIDGESSFCHTSYVKIVNVEPQVTWEAAKPEDKRLVNVINYFLLCDEDWDTWSTLDGSCVSNGNSMYSIVGYYRYDENYSREKERENTVEPLVCSEIELKSAVDLLNQDWVKKLFEKAID